jgi:hypothetical protein
LHPSTASIRSTISVPFPSAATATTIVHGYVSDPAHVITDFRALY